VESLVIDLDFFKLTLNLYIFTLFLGRFELIFLKNKNMTGQPTGPP